jgi:hypothetical protein
MRVRRSCTLALALLVCGFVVTPGPARATQPVDVHEWGIAANEMVYEPHSGLLFASVRSDTQSPATTVVALDPVTHAVGAPIEVGPRPGPLAVSADGRYLYVGVTSEVVQIDVATRTVTARWNIDLDSPTQPQHIEVMPGTNDTIAVTHDEIAVSPGLRGIGIYDNGVRRPQMTPGHTGPIWFAFTSSDHMVGYANNYNDVATLYQIAVGPDGLAVVGSAASPMPATTSLWARLGGGRVFAGPRVLDASSGATLALVGEAFLSTLVPDLERGRLIGVREYQYDDQNRGIILDIYDATSYVLVDSFDIGPTRWFPSLSTWDVEVLPGGVVAVATSMEIKLFDAAEYRGSAGEYTPLTPQRVLDTRTGVGTGGVASPVGSGAVLDVQISGRAGVPTAGVDAVVLNATVAAPTEQSYLTVWPSGGPRPGISNLNYAVGETRANLVTVALGDGGRLSLFNERGTAHVIFDVVGYYSTAEGPAGSRFRPLSPSRLFDTRGAAPVGPAGVLRFDVTGIGGVPDSAVTAVALNVTAVNATAQSFVTVWPDDAARPNASNLNFPVGGTVPNLVIMRVPESGVIDFFNESGNVHLLADVVGYYTSDRTGEGGRFVSFWPYRLLDTRAASPIKPPGWLIPGAWLYFDGKDERYGAYAMNVTATGTRDVGYVTVQPWPGPPPNASNVNYTDGVSVPNAVLVRTGPGIGFRNFNGTTHLIVDVFGAFTAA